MPRPTSASCGIIGNFDETYADILEGCTALLKSL